MNERDSEAIAALLLEGGHEPAPSEREADIMIVNTCSVRAKAEDKAIGKIGLMVSAKKKKPGRILVGVVGCMVQRMKEGLFDRLSGIDFAVSPGAISRLPG